MLGHSNVVEGTQTQDEAQWCGPSFLTGSMVPTAAGTIIRAEKIHMALTELKLLTFMASHLGNILFLSSPL